MDTNCNRIEYANQQPDDRPYSHGGAAVTNAYGLDFDARAYTPTDTATHAGGNVYIYRGAIVARQRAIVASDERRAGA